MISIEICNITKDYGGGKGVFDLSLSVDKGEALGFLGPNGAGKTTTIRQLLGFTRPQSGELSICGKDCFKDAAEIARSMGYIPGEIAFMNDMRGIDFVRFIAGMKKMNSLSAAHELMEYFELDPKGKIGRMSKGMKQKIGIVCAFMNDPDILILDEPTSGLDPIMQNKFVRLILSRKAAGKTVFMSSHMFEEVEKTCDRAAIIRNGRLVATDSIEALRRSCSKRARVRLETETQAKALAELLGAESEGTLVSAEISGEADKFIKTLSDFRVVDIEIVNGNLEESFMHFYSENGGVQND